MTIVIVRSSNGSSRRQFLTISTMFILLESTPKKIIRAIFVLRLTYNPCDIVVYKIKSIVNNALSFISKKFLKLLDF